MSSRAKSALLRAVETAAPAAGEGLRAPALATGCGDCPWHGMCLPKGLNFVELGLFDALVGRDRRLRKGQSLYLPGSPFRALYALRSGAVMSTIVAEDGREQVAGYHILGEVIGTDGIATGRHTCSAAAAADAEICAIPFDRLEALAHDAPGIQRNLYRLLSSELGAHHERMLMLGSMDARERLAAFLLDLSERYRRRGGSACELTLHLSREELGSYLGLKLETVSRAFSRLQAVGALQVQGRDVKLLDLPSLRQLLGREWRAPLA
jgi:CRP/FNR family transcriptional regulator